MLLGRTEQLAALRAAFAAVRESSRGRLVLLSGGAGSGKTTLLQEFCSRPGGPTAGQPAVTAPKDLVRVTYQNAYGTATSKTAVLAFSDSHPDVGVAASVSPAPVVGGGQARALITVGRPAAPVALSQ